MKKTDAIIILDGYGLSQSKNKNAIHSAKTPCLDYLFSTYPNCRLSASGLDVGLPEGQMGNSEVGHLNIGSGRIVYQDITAIDKSISDGTFFKNEAIARAMQNAIDKSLHLCGLISDGGVHSTLTHLYALIKMASEYKIKNVYIHCITDGRDTNLKSAINFIEQIQLKCREYNTGKIASIVGRFYYMDRDKRFDRLEKGYKCVFEGVGEKYQDPIKAVQDSYNNEIYDEFITPKIIGDYKGLNQNDSFIFFNFRADRAREITECATEKDFNEFEREFFNPLYVGFTQYDIKLKNLLTAFPPKNIQNTLGEYLSKNNKTQLRIAETEKYAHVTFFFNGGVEKENIGESRILIPSKKVKTYDLEPKMSALEVAESAIKEVGRHDVIILNFANCDMVGHTGNYEATIKAVEAVDQNLKKIVEAIISNDGEILLLSDHGNAETMINEDLSPMTAHTTNLVPLILISEKHKNAKLSDGILADIAPTFLSLLNLPIPKEMTGKNLLTLD